MKHKTRKKSFIEMVSESQQRQHIRSCWIFFKVTLPGEQSPENPMGEAYRFLSDVYLER